MASPAGRADRDGRLVWAKERVPGRLTLSVPGRLRSAVYSARWADTTYLLYRVEARDGYAGGDSDPEYCSNVKVMLELHDPDGDSIQEIENELVVSRLFEAVRSAVSGLKQRVAALMKEDVTHAQ